MQRKNKVILALAIGAVALVVASGAVRCSAMDTSHGPDEQAQPVETPQEETMSQQAQEPGQEGAQGGFADLKNTSWKSEDGKSALSIIEGALIESNEGGSSILYYTIDSEDAHDGSLTATLSVSSSMTGDEEKTVASVRTRDDGAREIACDRLACAYVLDAPSVSDVAIVGADENLYQTFGKDERDFAGVLLDYARQSAPSAKSATWSKEVWVDFNDMSYLTTFTLDDAASTIVSVRMDASGRLGAL